MITLPSGRKIGPGQAPFVIAEIGSNFRDLNDCRHSIAMAKAAGADAAKFQLYTGRSLYGFDHEVRGVLNPDWLPHLKAKADSVGIELMCSAFSPAEVEYVNGFVNLHKVASAELSHVRMLEKLRDIGKPVILSTGASGFEDIWHALNVLAHGKTGKSWASAGYDDHIAVSTALESRAIPLYCVAAYPAREINFESMLAIGEVFGLPVGFSDHSTDVGVIPFEAYAKGACVIEKHFTDIPEVDTPDRPHSLTVDQFKRMVEIIRNGPEKRIGYTREENPMVLRHNRRLVATTDIAPGEQLIEGENFGIYRSLVDDAKGLSPFAINAVAGRRAKVALKAGEGIGPKDIG